MHFRITFRIAKNKLQVTSNRFVLPFLTESCPQQELGKGVMHTEVSLACISVTRKPTYGLHLHFTFFFLPEYLAATAATVCSLHKIMNNCTEAKQILFSRDNQHQQQGAQHPGCNCAIATVSRPGAAVPIAELGGKKKKISLPAYNTTAEVQI